MHRLAHATSLLVTLLTTAACRERTPPATTENVPTIPAAEAPAVELAGCQATRREPLTCSLRSETTHLNLWVPGREAPLVELDGEPANARTRPSVGDAGWTIELDAPRTARELSVRLGTDGTPWTIALEATPPTPTVDAVETELLHHPSDIDARRRGIVRLQAEAPRMSSYERILAGRTTMLMFRELGEVERAIAEGERSLEIALEEDRASEAIAISQILVSLQRYRGDAAEVQLQLDLQSWYLPRITDAGQRVLWHYYRGVRAVAAGERRSALDEFLRAELDAQKLGLAADELAAASLRAPLLGLLGRRSELVPLVERILVLTLEAPIADRCDNAINLSNAGWGLLLARVHSASDDTAAKLFERALTYYGPGGGCEAGSNRDSIRNLQEARINYALEALTRSDWSEAETRAKAIDEGALQPGQHRWLQYIRGELALQHGDADGAFAAVHDLDPEDDLLLAWQSAIVEGRALEAMGRSNRALAAYLRAEGFLDDAVQALGVDQGREGLVEGMNSSAAHVIRLQLARGDVAAAAAAARRSRTRAMRPIGRAAVFARLPFPQRERWRSSLARYEELSRELQRELTDLWRLPQNERDRALRRHTEVRREMRERLDTAYDAMSSPALAEPPATRPGPGELWLLYHPTGDGWVGFALTNEGESAAMLSSGPTDESPEHSSARLLEPFANEIDAARRVDVLAMGDLDGVPFHTLPWRGAPLVSSRPVAYRLDLGVPRLGSPGADRGIAVVVADPASRRGGLGRLQTARTEGELVASSLRATGWNVTVLAGEQAVHTDVVAALVRADWLHYAGHGFSTTGWDSSLPLAGEAELGVREIIALPRVPATVVLSGCRTGTVDAPSDAGGQHLAAAFLLAGSHFVIATSADIADATAVDAAGALYDSLRENPQLDGPDLSRRAMLRREDGHPTVDLDAWQHYRAWVP